MMFFRVKLSRSAFVSVITIKYILCFVTDLQRCLFIELWQFRPRPEQ